MANWNQPALTDTYANFLAFLNAKVTDSALGLDPAHTTVTNPPANSIRYNNASNRWEKFVSGSWGALSSGYAISITGNAATATTLATTRSINGVNFNGSANITITANTPQTLSFNGAGSGAASGTSFNGGTQLTISYNSIGAPSTTGANASGTWAISVTGNAATATNATTAATCTGNAGSVTNGVYTTGDQSIGGVKTFTSTPVFGNSRAQVSGGGIAMYEMHIPGLHARGFYLDSDGITRFAVTNGSGSATTLLFSIEGNGNANFVGNVAANSDERLKQNWRDLPSDFLERLAEVKMGIYDRKDTGDTQAGVSAQSMRALLSPTVREGTDGMLSVAYGNAALVAAVELAREVVLLRRELNEMKGA
jgi:hypothetical protein